MRSRMLEYGSGQSMNLFGKEEHVKFVDRHLLLTREQARWLEKWSKETGNPASVLIRNLIQQEAAQREVPIAKSRSKRKRILA